MAWMALPLVFLLPGYLTLAAWRGARDLDFWEGLFLVPFTSILLSSWLGLVLAEAGLFSLPTLSLLLALCCLALALLGGRRLRLNGPQKVLRLSGDPSVPLAHHWGSPGKSARFAWGYLACLAPPRFDLTSSLLVVILALAGWAFARPAEVVAGTFDPGIYLSTGAGIARTGSIAFTEPFLARLGDDLRPFLLERRWETGIGAVRLPAFWMPQAQGDTAIPAFFHLYPVWLAILYSLGGIQAALLVSPIFGFLGVWALFLLGRRLAGPRVGLLAAALLALNPAQVWFARYPISEATVQMLLLGGLALWVLMEERRSRFLALLGGTALGLTHLTKIDQVFLPGALFLALFLTWFFKGPAGRGDASGRDASPRRLYWFLLAPYGLLLAHTTLHVYFFSFGYTWLTLGPFLPLLTSPPALALYLAGSLAVLAAALAKSRGEALSEWLLARRAHLSLALAGAVGLAALYGYFLWPLSPDPNPSPFLSSDGVTPVFLRMYREEGLVRLGWYLSPLGLLLGLAGFVQFMGARADRRAWPLLGLFVAQLTFYLLTAGLAYPAHFWASRRYLPLVIPALLLFASWALASLRVGRRDESATRPYLAALVPAALALALLASSLQTSARVLWNTEYQGALESLGRLASRLEDPAVVLFKPRTEGNIFAAPLQHLFGKTAFVLQREPEEPFMSRGVEQWIGEGQKVYLALTDRYPRYLSGNLSYSLVDDVGLEVRAMEQSLDRLPREVLPMSFPLRLYRLAPAAGYPYRLDMGPLRTEDVLRLRLPRTAARGLLISFRAWAGSPVAAPASLFLDGRLQQNLLVGPEPASYQFTLPLREAGRDEPLEITLAVGSLSGSEGRGIVLEWLQVEEAMGP